MPQFLSLRLRGRFARGFQGCSFMHFKERESESHLPQWDMNKEARSPDAGGYHPAARRRGWHRSLLPWQRSWIHQCWGWRLINFLIVRSVWEEYHITLSWAHPNRCSINQKEEPNLVAKCLVSGGGGLVTKSWLTLATPWTVAPQAPLSMGFSRQEYWSGLPFPSPGDLPDSEIEPTSPTLQMVSCIAFIFLTEWATREARVWTLSAYPSKLCHFMSGWSWVIYPTLMSISLLICTVRPLMYYGGCLPMWAILNPASQTSNSFGGSQMRYNVGERWSLPGITDA